MASRDNRAVSDAPMRSRSAAEAGWHESRYNIGARLPGSDSVVVANLFRGTCCEVTPLEGALLRRLDEIDEGHPVVERLAKRGIICDFEERAMLEAMGRAACAAPIEVSLTICPTMNCNFDCPYCFQEHAQPSGAGMDESVQDDVVGLAERMLDASRAKTLRVMWFGGEPLLAPGVIESLSARLSALAESRGASYRARITTNGFLLDRDASEMLGRASVESAVITMDGVGADHDATRHLKGGGPTFERIVANLRDTRHPFKIAVRHNIHQGNWHTASGLEALVERLSRESGNDISYLPALVSGNAAADARGGCVAVLDGARAAEVAMRQEAERFEAGRGHYCGANQLFNVSIDESGRLYKCWEALDKPEESFGRACAWDPINPFATADAADNLTRFLNIVGPIPDEECRECLWLPLCVGGCPYKRFSGARNCVPFKDDPEGFVLSLHAARHRTP
ncbi:MAG: radical SAM protein [Coriobacteriales bacterium]